MMTLDELARELRLLELSWAQEVLVMQILTFNDEDEEGEDGK